MKKKVIRLSLFLFAMGIGNILNAQVATEIPASYGIGIILPIQEDLRRLMDMALCGTVHT